MFIEWMDRVSLDGYDAEEYLMHERLEKFFSKEKNNDK